MLYASGMRKALAAGPSAIAVLFVAIVASAQNAQNAPKPKYKPQPLNLHRDGPGSQAGELGRTRMKNGDCAGALDAFDAALTQSHETTLYRDRGFCHEKLEHPFPAIDDYRAYLMAAPDAADADEVREKLAKLEDETSGRPARTTDDTNVPSAGASAPASTDASPTAPNKLEYDEPDEDALRTPLRSGKGWSIAPFLSVRGWLAGNTLNGSSAVSAESVGAQVRYATTARGALVIEAGYELFNLTDADAATISGLSALVGYEVRVPLDLDYQNQLLVTPGLGYEHLSVSPTTAEVQGFSLGAFVPRVRFGERHLLTPGAAIDVSIDAGVANFFQYSKFPYDSSQSLTVLLAANIGIVWAL
jgi:hypothetical protein